MGSWSSQDIRKVLETAACGAVDQGFKSPRARFKARTAYNTVILKKEYRAYIKLKSLAKCEDSVKYLLPIVRAEIAKQLMVKYLMSETEAAKLLGVSQASISHYMNGERGGKEHDIIKKWRPEIEKFASKAADDLIAHRSLDDVSAAYCELCRAVGIGMPLPVGETEQKTKSL